MLLRSHVLAALLTVGTLACDATRATAAPPATVVSVARPTPKPPDVQVAADPPVQTPPEPRSACTSDQIEANGSCHAPCSKAADCPKSQYCQDFHSLTKDGRIGPSLGMGCEVDAK